ncbi:helix-hairpin-helix domain-containing protein [Arachidicoccus terrestris]|uniref:hypothetical protein n=1 Tax=Arachidicoccus terrestris TaxID=2875539 RepID=UPI001CC3B59D|nr:hypothetical protein [Arachidicoccus terrestris]UAY56503.1 hypothetical protein K9M52_05720 [Arachidicoccus terrestris]
MAKSLSPWTENKRYRQMSCNYTHNRVADRRMHKCIPNSGAKIIHIVSTLLRDAEKDQISTNHADQLGQPSDEFFVSCVDSIFKSKQLIMTQQKTKRICPNGHSYYKTSHCPVCPVCAAERKPPEDFYAALAAPARRALLSHQINDPETLSQLSRKEVQGWHGIGDKAIALLDQALTEAGLCFRSQ